MTICIPLPSHKSLLFFSNLPWVCPLHTQTFNISLSLLLSDSPPPPLLPHTHTHHPHTHRHKHRGSGYGYGCTEAAYSSLQMFLIYNSWHRVLASDCAELQLNCIPVCYIQYAEGGGDTDKTVHSNSLLLPLLREL